MPENVPPAESQQPATPTPALATKANDLEALRSALIDAASVSAGLWLSYLFVLFYLLVAVGSVTQHDLLIQSPVKLPFLSVDLPLVGFFVLGPLIFLVAHAYVLLHFVLLANKVGVFDAELRAQVADANVRTRLRRQLPSNIFVQLLAGPHEVREGVIGLILRLIAQLSLVIGPIALLVFFQLQFLPYHQAAVIWWQRIAVVSDLALSWVLWPAISRGETIEVAWHGMRRGKIVLGACATCLPILIVFTIATFPGEWVEEHLHSRSQTSTWDLLRPLTALHNELVAGIVDPASRRPTSIWANRIVLPGFDLQGVSLRLRHLEGAVLIGADLRKADFTGSNLSRARLDDSDLRGGNFGCGLDTESPGKYCAQFIDASLDRAQLQGAQLEGANLQGASLE